MADFHSIPCRRTRDSDVSHQGYPGQRGVEFELDTNELVTLELEQPGVIRGRVVDAETGQPVPQFRIRMGFSSDRRPGDVRGTYNGSWSDPGLTFNADDGRFVIKPLTAGFAAELQVLTEGYDRALIDRAVAKPMADAKELDDRPQASRGGRPVYAERQTARSCCAPCSGRPTPIDCHESSTRQCRRQQV